MAATIWYAVARGQDFNWDQQNYHIGVPFLLAHGRFWTSVAPVGVQSYLNPYALQVQYLALRHLSPVGFAIALAAVQSLAFMAAGAICGGIAHPTAGWKAFSLGLLGFALCLMAPVSLSESGTTFIDLVTAIPVLASYALLLMRGRWLGSTMSAALAGALLGTATVLKLTNGLFLLGVIGFALAGTDTPGQRLKWLLTSGCAAMLAIVAVGGDWFLAVWKRFGNPLFPFWNNIFHSPDFSFAALRDVRFLPHSVLDIWHYPLYWLTGGSPAADIASPSAEVPFIDARWIVAISGCTLFLAALPCFREWRHRRLAEPSTGLLFAFVIGYLAWLVEFGVHRYMLPLDILCGAVIALLLIPIRPYALQLGALFVMTVASWHSMRVPDWQHLPWRPYWQGISPTQFDFGGRSIVFLTFKPSSFVLASLPPADAVGIDGEFDLRASRNTYLTRQLAAELASMPGALLKEVDDGAVPGISAAILASYGLVATGRCVPFPIAGQVLRICDVERRR